MGRTKEGRTRSSLANPPAFVVPCLAKLAAEPPFGEQWVHEIKFDGYRLQALIHNGTARLLTRTGLDWTPRFSAIAAALQKLRVTSAIIDGEAVVEDVTGASSFVRLVEALKAGRSSEIVFFGFDLMHLDGLDLTMLPFADRKARLEGLLGSTRPGDQLRYSAHLEGDGSTVLKQACAMGLEGIVSKRVDLPYRSGRYGDWVKSKCVGADEFVIAGYRDSSVKANAAGALLVGYFEGKRFVYAGRAGTGFSQKTGAALWAAMQPLRQEAAPFDEPLPLAQVKGVHWLKPKLVAQIEYRTWTGTGVLRQAAFKALREDKPARQVTRPDTKPDA